ncbi:MAG: hypothetical protein Ct9H300mP1_08580 [Planctomycetaceae bacterium]|nr:MAG: hypothetical protein Ct9H300mP1_08580 [Planctomycetaceae bacterium]
MPTRSYLSQAELPVTFGFGGDQPGRKTGRSLAGWNDQEIADPKIDSFHEITHSTRQPIKRG